MLTDCLNEECLEPARTFLLARACNSLPLFLTLFTGQRERERERARKRETEGEKEREM
jgi:hypothetical protein